ncbi:MAG: phosphate-starvation-inducible PsiE family protein [Gammaproteobacteria bacterium]|jgi:uncharacterized membrane protein (DUF373 family)
MKLKDINLLNMFQRIVDVIFSVILLMITFGIVIGVIHLFKTVGFLVVHEQLTRDYQAIISQLLTLFILVELIRSIVDYFTSRRLRMTFIVDATIVFILREIMIDLFETKINPDQIYAISVLLLVLSILRFGSIMLYRDGLKRHDAVGKP